MSFQLSQLAVFVGAGLAILAIGVWIYLWMHKHHHGGLGVLRRRRVLRKGLPAEATVLSVRHAEEKIGQHLYSVRAIVYDVRPHGDHPPFRAKSFERSSDGRDVEEWAIVQVRFDPADRAVVLVPVDPRDAQRRKRENAKAREAELLRDEPSARDRATGSSGARRA